MTRNTRISCYLLLSIVSTFAIQTALAGNFIYPFAQIAKPECRYSKWSELNDECKMPIPRIENANYEKYKKDTKYRRIYSVLWGATYDFGWDSGQGSHQWVDIATSEGTPVIAIGEGEVVVAGALSGWGNTVSVKHRLTDGKTIFSNFSHLSAISVKKWQKVRQGEELGTVGNTGNSYGNHLHFQIDTTDQSHPYYFVTCGKGTDPITLVNKGMCREFLEKNTVDPIAFLEGGAISTPITTAQIQAIQNTSKNVTIDRKTIKSREQIEEEEIQEFFRNRSFQIVAGISRTQIQAGGQSQVTLRVFENGRPYNGILPAGWLDIDQNAIITTFPTKILLVEKGSRLITINGKKWGKTDLVVHIGKNVRQSIPIVVYKPNEFKTVNRMDIRQKPTVFLGSNTVGAVIVRTPYGTPQVSVPYDGTFVLSAIQGKAKFCNVSDTLKASCPLSRMTDTLEFDYSKTKQGVLVFQISPLDFSPIQLEVREKKGNRKVGSGRAGIRVDIPLGMDNRTPYFDSIVWALKSGITTTDRYGYVQSNNPVLVQELRPILQQYANWLALKYPERKAKNKELADRVRILVGQDGYSTVSRWQLAKILTGTPASVQPARNKYLDQKGEYEPTIEWLANVFWFEWKDSFGSKYFQPNIPIKLWEALYLLEIIGHNAYKL